MIASYALPVTGRDRALSFEIFADRLGWHARRIDGLVEGTFVSREDALRFVRRESLAAAPA